MGAPSQRGPFAADRPPRRDRLSRRGTAAAVAGRPIVVGRHVATTCRRRATPRRSRISSRAFSLAAGSVAPRPRRSARGQLAIARCQAQPHRSGRRMKATGRPRQAPDAGAPPAYRSYGGVVEHRGTPPAPAPAQSAPREQGPPPSAGAPRGEAHSSGEARLSGEARPSGQSRSGGQGQPNRGSAVRRGGGWIRARDSGRGTRNSGRGTRDSGLGARDSGPRIADSDGRLRRLTTDD
jgi:hypothetical protein